MFRVSTPVHVQVAVSVRLNSVPTALEAKLIAADSTIDFLLARNVG